MPKTMKLTDVGHNEQTVLKYIADPDWVMQQKFDGTRIMMTWNAETGVMLWSNDGLKPVTHAAAKLKLPDLEAVLVPVLEKLTELTSGRSDDEISLDGELLIRTGEFLVWDMLYAGEDRPWFERHEDLRVFMTFLNNTKTQDLIKMTPTAETRADKEIMWESIKQMNVEGAVSKNRYSHYVPGIRTKEWVKHKLVKTADLVVGDVRRVFKPNSKVVKEGSAQLQVFNNGIFQTLVSASLIGKDLTIAAGDVVEVAYLYREPGGGLVQPRIVRKRWDAASQSGDKSPTDCDFTQFPEYSRDVVEITMEAAV